MNWLLYTVIAIFVFSAFFFASWQKHRILRALKQYREGLEKLFSKAEPYYPGFAFRMKLIRWLSKGEYEEYYFDDGSAHIRTGDGFEEIVDIAEIERRKRGLDVSDTHGFVTHKHDDRNVF